MIYEYRCAHCRTETEVIKSWKDCDRTELCEECGTVLKRTKYWPDSLQIHVDNFPSHYSHAFGKRISSKHELHNEIKRHNGEQGTDLVEIGNDRTKPKRSAPKRDYREAAQEMKRIRGI